MIAIVDDDPAVRNSLKFSLELEGYEVCLYPTAADFLAETNQADCHCLLLDYAMPQMNGLELLSILRQRNIKVPAILITGKANPRLAARASAAGVPLVEKPFLGSTLLNAIRSAIPQ